MASRFASQMQRGAGQNLARQFGETVTYYPRNGASGRSIVARVERSTLAIVQETLDVSSQAMIVSVENNAKRGIASTEIDTGGDEISLPIRTGENPQRRSIARIINDNAGRLRLLIQ